MEHLRIRTDKICDEFDCQGNILMVDSGMYSQIIVK